VEDNSQPKADKDLKLRELTTVMGPVEAEVIKTFLESQGIPCILRGRMAQSIYPISVDGMGEIRIMVSEKDLALAAELLAQRPPQEED
jgi:Putative prokaryotic signal transducing protein